MAHHRHGPKFRKGGSSEDSGDEYGTHYAHLAMESDLISGVFREREQNKELLDGGDMPDFRYPGSDESIEEGLEDQVEPQPVDVEEEEPIPPS